MTGDKFIPELHLKQAGFTYRACGPFTKHCERIQKFREEHLYRNEFDSLNLKFVLLMMQQILIVKI